MDLTELRRERFPTTALSSDQADELWANYRQWLDIRYPSPVTDGEWELYSKGAVGYLPLADGAVLNIRPRVPIRSIFRMWEIADGIALEEPAGDVGVQTLEDLLDWIAVELSRGVLRRLGQGLYRAYVDEVDELPFLRGRLNLRAVIEHPWRVALPCEFQNLTADVPDNRILLAGLQAASYAARKTSTLALLRRSWWLCTQSGVSPTVISARDCLGRTYNRLNADYERLHWLCHFILSGTVPTHLSGKAKIHAFILQMPTLFERFVAAWLIRSLPTPLRCQSQVILPLDRDLNFRADLVITGRDDKPIAVLDTKYKLSPDPEVADIAQVVAYAQHLGCREAILLYPTGNLRLVDIPVHDIRVRSLTFELDGDLDFAGRQLIELLGLSS